MTERTKLKLFFLAWFAPSVLAIACMMGDVLGHIHWMRIVAIALLAIVIARRPALRLWLRWHGGRQPG